MPTSHSDGSVKRFTIPCLPASVNHYVKHSKGRHYKSRRAEAFEQAFGLFCDCSSPVTGSYFAVSITVYPQFGKGYDIDNYLKQTFDCIARMGLLVSPKGKPLTDYYIRECAVKRAEYDGDPRLEIEIRSL